MGLHRLTLLALVASALTACSPYNYSKEISDFSKDVDQVAQSYKDGYTGLASDYAAQTRRLRILDRAYLELSASCRVPVSDVEGSAEVCTLERVDHRPARPLRPHPLPLDSNAE